MWTIYIPLNTKKKKATLAFNNKITFDLQIYKNVPLYHVKMVAYALMESIGISVFVHQDGTATGVKLVSNGQRKRLNIKVILELILDFSIKLILD